MPEAELMAAFVSKLNRCEYWTGDHTAVAVLGLEEKMVNAALDDWQTAPLEPRLKAAFAYLDKLILAPKDLGVADIIELRESGLSDRAIEEVAYVAYLFSVMDRLADTFDFDIPNENLVSNTAQFLYKHGYKLAKMIRWISLGRAFKPIDVQNVVSKGKKMS